MSGVKYCTCITNYLELLPRVGQQPNWEEQQNLKVVALCGDLYWNNVCTCMF